MKNSELIAEFINKVVAGDVDGARDAFSTYCNAKAKGEITGTKVMERFEQFKNTLLEYGNEEVPLRMEGDKIFVNNTLVGHVKVDLSNFDSGIDFVSEDGTFSKEFNTAEDLFAYLSQKYLGEKNVK